MRPARMSSLPRFIIWLASVGLVLYLGACSGPQQGDAMEILRIGVLPDESVEALRERYDPLLEFLAHETGFVCQLVVPDSYQDLLNKFGAGQLDLAYFGGVTFVKAQSAYDAIPVVMRDVDSRFTSVLLVAGDSTDDTLGELKGKRFSFGARLSTSGHLMPRHFLQSEYDITPEEYFGSVRYSGQHDRTAYWVRDGEVEAGVVNTEIVQRMLTDGRLQAGDIRTIWTTPSYADYVWAAHPQVSEVRRERIQDAFLKLSLDNPGEASILVKLGAAAFYPASTKDFSMLGAVMSDAVAGYP